MGWQPMAMRPMKKGLHIEGSPVVRTIQIQRDGQELGLFDEDQVPALLQSGWLLGTDHAWNGQLSQWEPLNEFVAQQKITMENVAPLPVNQVGTLDYQSMMGGPAIWEENQPAEHETEITAENEAGIAAEKEPEDHRPLPWRSALFWALATNIYGIILTLGTGKHSIGYQEGTSGWPLFGGFYLILILYVLSVYMGYSLHYYCWLALPPRHRKLSPEHAVGHIFILGLNFYWYFKTFIHLAQGYQSWAREVGHKVPGSLVVRAICLAVAWDVSWLMHIVDRDASMRQVLYMDFLPLLLVLNIIYYIPIIRLAHGIHGRKDL